MCPDASSQVPAAGANEPSAPAGILTVVFVYAAFASLWILLSDKATEWLFADPAQITLASTIKGWAFVAVTSTLLYGLMRRLLHRPGAADPAVVTLRPLVLPLVLLTVAIISMTVGAIIYTVVHQKDKEVARLQTIADLKTRQITDWLGEHYGDTRFVQARSFWIEPYRRWKNLGDTASRDLFQDQLKDFLVYESFQSALLLDERGGPLWSSENAPIAIDPALREAVRKAVHDNRVTHLGPYRDAGGYLYLDFIAPLQASEGRPGQVIVLKIDPGDYLFPTLQTWPTPSVSGETLLFRRDGDQVLFLNELRHQAGTAAKLRVPVAEKKLLAAQILRGDAREGKLVEGVDYRGVPAMGVVRAIPGTDWFLVAKVDRGELYNETIPDVLWIALAGLLALFMAATSVFIFRHRHELAASLREREIQAEKLRALQLLDAIAEGSADAIFAKDTEGRYLLFNREAARVTGKESQEVLGRDDTEIFPLDQAARVMANDRQVMKENRSVTFQEDVTTIGGEISFLATKGPLHDSAGNVIGMFGISRDITERRRAEEALRDSLEEKVALLKEVHHRVKNNLQIVASLLSLQASRAPTQEVVDVLHDTRDRVRSMSLLHEVLYRSGNLARINFAVYVKELCTQLLRSFGPASGRVKVENHVAPIGLALEQAVPCGLIISELLSNSLKHGFPEDRRGRVVVGLHPDDGRRLAVSVRDDGVGLPPDFDTAATSTLGLKLVSNLADQLGGQLAMERPREGGAAFRVVFPVPEDTPL